MMAEVPTKSHLLSLTLSTNTGLHVPANAGLSISIVAGGV